MQAPNTLRPGLLVNLKTAIRGNIGYEHRDIKLEHLTDAGARIASWETERTIADPDEYDTAVKIRTRIRTVINSACVRSAFGLLCPEKAADNLDKALAEARRLADEFNTTAKLTRIDVYVLTGRIAPDDVEAMRALNSEARDLLTTMADGIGNLDVTAVRDAADRARALGRMLSPEAQARIGSAVDAARNAARKIVKAGEQAAQEIDQQTIRRLAEARTAFLDLEPAADVATPPIEGRALDFEPLAEITPAPAARATFELE
jgi:hypothetical protein